MLTEDEAKKKWCPLYRITALEWIQNATDNRGRTLEENVPGNCLASDCMAWREKYDSTGEIPMGGYCGLAGE